MSETTLWAMDSILNNNIPSSIVILESMPQQLGTTSLGDDWTGVTSTSERRKRQNRLHQRAYRRKRRDRLVHLPSPKHYFSCTASEAVDSDSLVLRHQDEIEEKDRKLDSVLPEGHLLLPTPESRAEVQRFAQRAYEDYNHGAPRLEHLHILVRLNVLTAIARNATLLGFRFEGLCCPKLVSPFNQQVPDLPSMFTPSQPCPEGLRPTALQIEVRHHPWIDLIPIPRMRDNVLRAIRAGLLDNKAFGLDVLNVEDIQGEAACLIVWGEPWDPRGWEASVPFLRKWGWLIEGCSVMLE
ncbi:hypothetical protein DL95DRAFT_393721, partial [Leptodontidium sp. 2 PMI_412]